MAADEIHEFIVSTPAGTLASAPLVTLTQLLGKRVEAVTWRVPAGALGVMGWRISMRGVQIIPRNTGGWIIADNTDFSFSLRDQPDSGDWSVTSYNTGQYAHAVTMIFHAEVIRPRPRPPRILTLAGGEMLSQHPDPDWRPR